MKVLVAASFAGAANVLLPVLRRLQIRPDVKIRVIAERQALSIFRGHGIPAEEVPAGPGERGSFLLSLFKDAPDALLLGTSWGAGIDKDLIRIGREQGVPSLSVVDHWSNYRERFLEPGTRRLCLPDRIALMDCRALERAVEEGLPRDILEVAGQPHLQSLAGALKDPALLRQAADLRAGWLRGAGRPLLLFCSELFLDNRGYTGTDALEGISSALDLLEAAHPVRPQLVVKLHPKEPAAYFQPGPRASRRGFLLAKDEPAWVCLLAADVLAGMTSMLLVEAAIAGRPVISYQPEKGVAATFIGTETGIVRSARSIPELASLLSDSFLASQRAAEGAVQPGFLRGILSGDAAGQITDLLLELSSR